MKPTHPELLTMAVAFTWFALVTAILALGGWTGLYPVRSMLFIGGSMFVVAPLARRYFNARARRRGERWPKREW
jgi:hypothetical protein